MEPRTIRSGRKGPAVVAAALFLLMAAFPAMLLCFTVYFTGWRSGDPVVRTLMGSTFLLVALSWLAWRFLPMRMAEVTFDVTGITFRETQNGKTRFARQTIAWSEIYALLGTGRKRFFGVELHTNGPPPGRRIVTSISGGGFVVSTAVPYAKAAGYHIKPVFMDGFLSEEIWKLFKTDG
ncbi:hypothetical protein AN191_16000 [Loktanella sp. 5RATIMAR09]|nr:hypothetical protein AN191_16000 [Loktanella sp. 5RATIMAR09]